MMLLPIIIFVVLILFIINSTNGGTNINFRKNEYSNSALDILDKRFANGEISEEEYLKRRAILQDK